MDIASYNKICEALAHTTHVVQWGDSHVWKIGGKMFAIGGWAKEASETIAVTFKVTPIAYDILREQPGLRPAPYLASRGMKWIQRTSTETMSDSDLADYIAQSYQLVAAGLPKKTQRALGLID